MADKKTKDPANKEKKELIRLARMNCKHKFDMGTLDTAGSYVTFTCVKCRGRANYCPDDDEKQLYYDNLYDSL